ncbi:YqjK-like family protein [Halomonas cibimaris]|uniref:YqjK-like family protein n=1 Tax=Halomonas cibimaris TaxID=657012 RepID=A0ABP7LI81_9GAMM
MPVNHADSSRPPRPPSRAARKRELLDTLEQQRIDIMVESLRLERAATPLDRGWHTLRRYKAPLLLAGGGVAWQLLRRPGKALRLGRRALGGYVLLRKLQRLST